MPLRKAEKRRVKLRLGIVGTSGSGKTYSSLGIAMGLGGSVALIDWERKSAEKYADEFDFDYERIDGHNYEAVCETLREIERMQLPPEVLIIDGISPGHDELQIRNERIAIEKFRGNAWSARSVTKPIETAFLDTILNYPGHVIVTMRAKTTWLQEEYDGKKRPVKIGMGPIQRPDIEYEFDMYLLINEAHSATIVTHTSGKSQQFEGRVLDNPGIDFGRELSEWLDKGKAEPTKTLTKPSGGAAPPEVSPPSSAEATVDEPPSESVVKPPPARGRKTNAQRIAGAYLHFNNLGVSGPDLERMTGITVDNGDAEDVKLLGNAYKKTQNALESGAEGTPVEIFERCWESLSPGGGEEDKIELGQGWDDPVE